MKKKLIAIGILGMFLLAGLTVVSAVGMKTTSGDIIYVHPDESIQDAIDDADDGDTVFVYSGTYYENIVIDKSIILEGENKETTIIDGKNENTFIVEIYADSVNFSHFSVINSGNNEIHAAINIFSNNNTIFDNNIFNPGNNCWAIRCYYCKNNVIANNTVLNSSDGIWVIKSNNNTIKNNQIFGDETGSSEGIWLYNASDNLISDNTISKNGVGIFSNLISRNNTIINNDISKNWVGIKLRLCSFDNTVISHNVISFSDWAGISLSGFGSINTHINVSGNTINYTSNNYNDDSYGLRLSSCSNIIIYNNTIEFNRHGIKLSRSNNNTIIRNEISGNTYFGMNLDYHYFSFSFRMRRYAHHFWLSPSSSKNNTISKNNFMNNDIHAFYCYPINDTHYSNQWNENYWDNWIGLKSKLFRESDKLILGVRMKIMKRIIRRSVSVMVPVISFDLDSNPQLEPYDL